MSDYRLACARTLAAKFRLWFNGGGWAGPSRTAREVFHELWMCALRDPLDLPLARAAYRLLLSRDT